MLSSRGYRGRAALRGPPQAQRQLNRALAPVFDLACLRCGAFAHSRPNVIPLRHRLPKLLPLLRAHVPAPSSEPAAAPPSGPAMMQPSKQNPAQQQQSQRLPETQHSPSAKRRQQPVPQVHDHFTAHENKQRNPNNCQRQRSTIFIFSYSSSLLFEIRRTPLQSLAQMQHRIPFPREQRIHTHAALCGHFLEASPFRSRAPGIPLAAPQAIHRVPISYLSSRTLRAI